MSMGLVKVVIDKHGGTTKLLEKPTARKEAKVVEAVIELNGNRAVDTAKITVDSRVPVAEGDVIKYIQDIVPTEGLRGFYNFQENPRDESGNDADENGTQTGDYGNSNRTTWSRNIDKYLQVRGAADDWVDIKSEKMIEDATEEVINLSGKFDMYFWFRILGTPLLERHVLAKRASGGTGFTFIRDVTDHMDFRIYDGAGAILDTLQGTNVVSGTVWHMARVKRDENNLISFYIDGVLNDTGTSSQNLTTTTNLQFGNDGLGTTVVDNMDIGQFRIYCGTYLSDDDANKIFTYKRQHSIMKFAGTVYKIDERTNSKVIHAKSWGRVLSETEANPNSLDARDESANNNGIDNVFLDDATNRMTPHQMIEQTLATLDNSNTYRKWLTMPYATTPPTSPVISKYVMSGNLLRVFQLLTYRVAPDQFFLTTPRKVMFFGDLDNINATPSTTLGYKFINGKNCRMTNTGRDDTKVINEIEILSENLTQRRYETDADSVHSGGGGLPWTIPGDTVFELERVPIGTVNVVSDSAIVKAQVHETATLAANQFKLDTLNKSVELGTAPGTSLTVEYEYEDTSNENVVISDGTSIQKYGKKTRRIFMGGAKDLSLLSNIATNMVTIFKDVNERVTVEVPYLANELQVFQLCNLVNDVKDGSGGNPALGNGNYRIQSMKFLYPEGKTIINFGEHIFDSYDYDITLSEKHRENAMIITKTKHVKV